ncbi:MAG: DNA translocase FtsK 4TM domain-containing protein [Pseudomonadota bacterium]|nr:DNA translocase FtsK 4TM domain-containing protein [Pseudomonadota bacterium]
MSQATRARAESADTTYSVSRGLREGALFLSLAVAVYLLLALLTYDSGDRGWSRTGFNATTHNVGGRAGALLADVLLYLFGYAGYLFPMLVGVAGWWFYSARGGLKPALRPTVVRTLGFLMTLACGAAIGHLHFSGAGLPLGAGGVLGQEVASLLVRNFSFVGGTLFLLALFLTGVTWLTGVSWIRLSDLTGAATLRAASALGDLWRNREVRREGQRVREERKEKAEQRVARVQQRKPVRIEPVVRTPETSLRVEQEKQGILFESSEPAGLPALALLDEVKERPGGISPEALEAISRRLELKLEEFGIEAQVTEVHPGPVVTQFELEPAPGVKVNQIVNLAKDLARALSVISVRVVEVIPGKSTVGIEIPNEDRETVRLSETLRSRAYDESSSVLTLALGKDIQGMPVVADIAKMPHLLVSGTTGSGKSVAINAMILSLLYKATPAEIRLIMIDPKMLELSVYDGIAHLLAPVVTDMNEAVNALQWCVAEMDDRYRRMAALGVRNIAGYNRKVTEAQARGEPLLDPLYTPPEPEEGDEPELRYCERLPYIVVVVDELADMMMLVGKKVEQLIARLAQKARAAGVHLILATQRPSVDVITGLIKANIPSRIAFQVSSKVDSRTILDQMGAEQLLGHGDMLYLPVGTGVPRRVHGAFVSDEEVHRVVAALRKQGAPDYLDEILKGDPAETGRPGAGGGDPEDELYDQAVYLVTSSRRASVSGVQRHLRIGYNRAARLVEEMERQGVVGPLQANGQREVLAEAVPE